MKNERKGFTITELVIVIVVIAILAAVLIPTFSSLIKKANVSSDEQAAREMNTVLSSASVKEKPATLKEVIDILEEAGFDALALEPHTKGYEYYWCSEHNTVMLVEEAGKTVKFPTDKKLAESFATHLADGKALVLKEGAKFINVEVNSENIVEALQAGSDVTLTEDIVMDQTIPVKGDMTINLNGHKLSGANNSSRPLEMTNGAKLTVQGGDKDIDCGKFGMVNVPASVKECTVTLENGNYNANTDNGAFVKLRPGADNVNITLKNVNYVDSSNDGFLMNANQFGGDATILIEGGSYTAHAGFNVPGNAKFVGVTINTSGAAFEITGNAELIDCVITTANATVGSAPAAGVAVSNGGTAKVSGCKINTSGAAFYVYSTGGTIIANNNTIGTCRVLADGTQWGTITVNGVTQ
ncbi:MAG: prepilin-type N-terminal cleavage/methylation domain-containing protein [Ruminococcaceae bacterium]|nr:prepilin-type N-terminal cleavage/methylation domain-containing protein [Oscillospiraceae bacterium]